MIRKGNRQPADINDDAAPYAVLSPVIPYKAGQKVKGPADILLPDKYGRKPWPAPVSLKDYKIIKAEMEGCHDQDDEPPVCIEKI